MFFEKKTRVFGKWSPLMRWFTMFPMPISPAQPWKAARTCFFRQMFGDLGPFRATCLYLASRIDLGAAHLESLIKPMILSNSKGRVATLALAFSGALGHRPLSSVCISRWPSFDIRLTTIWSLVSQPCRKNGTGTTMIQERRKQGKKEFDSKVCRSPWRDKRCNSRSPGPTCQTRGSSRGTCTWTRPRRILRPAGRCMKSRWLSPEPRTCWAPSCGTDFPARPTSSARAVCLCWKRSLFLSCPSWNDKKRR